VGFQWEKTSREQFERAVELLLERKHEKATTTFAPDGRGGDGGIDFLAQERRTLTIYQLKHYPDGLKSSTQSRKRAIRESFEAAQAHSPHVWVLVVPAKLTVAERDFVLALQPAGSRPRPRVRLIDLPKLELLLTKYPKIRSHLDREPLLDAIEDRQIEVAEPRNIDEVLARATSLASRAGHLDPDWDVDLFVIDGVASVLPRPTHPKAAERSPLGFTLTVDPSKMSSELQATLERSVGFGTGEAVQIPAEAIASLTTSGPQWQWMRGEYDFELEPVARAAPDAALRLELTDANGAFLGEHEGVVTHVSTGVVGHTLEARFYSGLVLQLLLPRDKDQPGTGNISLSVHRLYPADARDSLALFRVLGASVTSLRAFIDDTQVAGLTLTDQRLDDDTSRDVLEQFADDFDFLQRHARTRRMLPVNISVLDRATARTARMIIEGACVFLPPTTRFSATIDTGGERRWIEQLRETLLRGHAMLARIPDLRVDVAGLAVSVGPVALYAPSVRIHEADRLLPMIDRGEVDGERITYVADHLGGWRGARLPESGAPESWTPAPWGLVDANEHPGFDVGLEAVNDEALTFEVTD
jgi:hypothetical protein